MKLQLTQREAEKIGDYASLRTYCAESLAYYLHSRSTISPLATRRFEVEVKALAKALKCFDFAHVTASDLVGLEYDVDEEKWNVA